MSNIGQKLLVQMVTTPEEFKEIISALVREISRSETHDRGGTKPLKKTLTPKEVAKEYGFEVKTLERWRYDGIGPTYSQCGRKIYYERVELEKYIAACRVHTYPD